MPLSAPLPAPTSNAAGVAIPRAHGQAMITTETKASKDEARPIPPRKYHVRADPVAIRMTNGTKKAEIRSASRCNGAFPICASSTSFAICERTVSCPTFVARIFSSPVSLIVAPITSLPAVLSRGRLSPVIMDSSAAELPSTTTPSTGIRSPGRTTRTSSTWTCSTGI